MPLERVGPGTQRRQVGHRHRSVRFATSFDLTAGGYSSVMWWRSREGYGESNMSANTVCLWFDKDAEEAARFYSETFPDSTLGAVQYAPSDFPSGKEGDPSLVEFTVLGIACVGLNGGPEFSTTKRFRSKSQPMTKPKPTATGTRSSATAVRRASADGVRTNGGCRGRSRRLS